MRRIGIAAGIVLVLLTVIVAVFVATFNVNRYRGTIQSQLEKRLARKVTMGEMHLSLFPPRFRAENLTVAEDPAFATGRAFAQTRELDLSVRLFPLLKGVIQVDSLDLRHTSIELVKSRRGAWNFASLGRASESSAGGAVRLPLAKLALTEWQPGVTKSSTGSTFKLSLAKLDITDGQLAVTDLQAGKPRALYEHINANIRGFAPGERFSFYLAPHLPGPATQEVRFQGQGGPIVTKEPAATPFHGILDMNQVEIAGLRRFLNSQALADMGGLLSGQAEVTGKSGTVAANGKVNVEKPQIDGRALGYAITADYQISNDVATDVIVVRNTTITLGKTPVIVNGTVDIKPMPTQVDLRLKTDNVSVTEAARLAAAFGVSLAPGTTVTGKISASVRARGASDKPVLSGLISGRNIEINGKDIPQTMKAKSINLTFTPTEFRSDNFNLTSGATALAAHFTLQQYLSKSPFLDATLRATDAGLPDVLSMARAYGVTALNAFSGRGKLNMDLHATGPLAALNSAKVIETLNGTLKLNLNDMRYAGIDVSYQLASIGGFLKSNETDQGFTDISRMTGDIAIKNGVAQTNNLLAQLDIGNIGATGTANLVNEALNLHMTAILTKDFSRRVGGTGIAGYLNTALANNQGELVIPAIVTGTFQNPKFTPDLQKIAQMKLKGLVPNSNNPLEGVAGILGELLRKKGGSQTQQQLSQPSPVQQIIDILQNKKKQATPPQGPARK